MYERDISPLAQQNKDKERRGPPTQREITAARMKYEAEMRMGRLKHKLGKWGQTFAAIELHDPPLRNRLEAFMTDPTFDRPMVVLDEASPSARAAVWQAISEMCFLSHEKELKQLKLLPLVLRIDEFKEMVWECPEAKQPSNDLFDHWLSASNKSDPSQ